LALRPEPELRGLTGGLSSSGKHFAIVVSRFNAFITERLLQSAYDGLLRSGTRKKDIQIVRVPGAFEIPLAARKLAETKEYDAIICIGCVLRGETPHFEYIATEVARGIQLAQINTGVPMIFCVLTCDTLEQAIDRAGLKSGNKGLEAGFAAVEMADLARKIASAPKPARAKRSAGRR